MNMLLIDSLSVLPASFVPRDANKMLSLCPSIQTALKANKALILGDSYVFSTGFVKDLYERMEKDLDTISFSGPSSTGFSDDCHVTKVAKSGQETTADLNDTSSESGSNKQAAGIDSETVLVPLANHLRPMLLNAWNERRKAALTDNGQKIKRLLDNLQKKLDESSLNMQLYEKGLDLFEDNPSTLALLHRHLLRTTAAPMVDMLLLNMDMLNKLKNGLDVQDIDNPESISISSGTELLWQRNLMDL